MTVSLLTEHETCSGLHPKLLQPSPDAAVHSVQDDPAAKFADGHRHHAQADDAKDQVQNLLVPAGGASMRLQGMHMTAGLQDMVQLWAALRLLL